MKRLLASILYILRSALDPFLRFTEVAVLAYHSISDDAAKTSVPVEAFRAQLEALRDAGYAFVTLADVVAWQSGRKALPRKAVAVTFDDGYADFTTAALPVLRSLGIPATLFLVGDLAAYQAKLPSRLSMLDASALAALREEPLVELGYHTRTHPDVRTLDDEGIARECAPLPRMRYFAYPGGNYSDRVLHALPALGYEAAFSIKPELVHPGQDRFLLPRSVIERGMSTLLVRILASRASTWYRMIRRALRHG
jgi:peptidoglycan/xylan/chitin deacetylase (PgdA/CDA1 family)